MKIGETKLLPLGGEALASDSSEKQSHRRNQLPIPSCVYDPLEIVFTLRGIGWDFGRDVYIPQETRSLERGAFLRSTSLSFLGYYFLLDGLESVMKLIPGVGSPEGGSIFFPQLPFFQRYVVSTVIHICTGTSLLSGFQMVYNLCTLVSVGVLGQSPLSWPPIFNNPWAADSLNVFWAQRWHQLLRRMFVVYGGYPGSWILGPKLGMVFGTFLASGLFHELTTYTMGKGLDHRITLFFLWQAVGVVLERMWKKATGYRVQGWGGLAWVYFSIMVIGQPCVDAWHLRGLGGGSIVIPPSLSLTRIVLLPALKQLSIL